MSSVRTLGSKTSLGYDENLCILSAFLDRTPDHPQRRRLERPGRGSLRPRRPRRCEVERRRRGRDSGRQRQHPECEQLRPADHQRPVEWPIARPDGLSRRRCPVNQPRAALLAPPRRGARCSASASTRTAVPGPSGTGCRPRDTGIRIEEKMGPTGRSPSATLQFRNGSDGHKSEANGGTSRIDGHQAGAMHRAHESNELSISIHFSLADGNSSSACGTAVRSWARSTRRADRPDGCSNPKSSSPNQTIANGPSLQYTKSPTAFVHRGYQRSGARRLRIPK